MSGKAKAALLIGALILLSFLAPKGSEGQERSPKAARGETPAPPAAKGIFFSGRKAGKKAGNRGTSSLFQEGRQWQASIFQVAGATLLVLVLAGGAVFLLSRLQKRRGPAGKRRALALVETLPLGRRKRLVLARASERLLLLGETEKGITLLMELGEEESLPETPPMEEEEEEEAGPAPEIPLGRGEIPFRRILKAGAAGGD